MRSGLGPTLRGRAPGRADRHHRNERHVSAPRLRSSGSRACRGRRGSRGTRCGSRWRCSSTRPGRHRRPGVRRCVLPRGRPSRAPCRVRRAGPSCGAGAFQDGRGSSEGTGIARGVLTLRYRDDVSPPPLEPAEYLRQVLALAERLSGEHVEARLAAIVGRIRSLRCVGWRWRGCATSARRTLRRAVCSTRLRRCGSARAVDRRLALGPPVDGRATLSPPSDADASDEASPPAPRVGGAGSHGGRARAMLSLSLRSPAAWHRRALHRPAGPDGGGGSRRPRAPAGAQRPRARAGGGACARPLRYRRSRPRPARRAKGIARLRAARRRLPHRRRRYPGAVCGAMPGQLSLASDGGEVSLADDARGRLDLARERAAPDAPARPGLRSRQRVSAARTSARAESRAAAGLRERIARGVGLPWWSRARRRS